MCLNYDCSVIIIFSTFEKYLFISLHCFVIKKPYILQICDLLWYEIVLLIEMQKTELFEIHFFYNPKLVE